MENLQFRIEQVSSPGQKYFVSYGSLPIVLSELLRLDFFIFIILLARGHLFNLLPCHLAALRLPEYQNSCHIVHYRRFNYAAAQSLGCCVLVKILHSVFKQKHLEPLFFS